MSVIVAGAVGTAVVTATAGSFINSLPMLF